MLSSVDAHQEPAVIISAVDLLDLPNELIRSIFRHLPPISPRDIGTVSCLCKITHDLAYTTRIRDFYTSLELGKKRGEGLARRTPRDVLYSIL